MKSVDDHDRGYADGLRARNGEVQVLHDKLRIAQEGRKAWRETAIDAEAEIERLQAALRLCEHVLHRAQPCDAMLHAAQQAAGAYATDWTLVDVADDLAPGTVLDVDDPEIDWNEVRWND